MSLSPSTSPQSNGRRRSSSDYNHSHDRSSMDHRTDLLHMAGGLGRSALTLTPHISLARGSGGSLNNGHNSRRPKKGIFQKLRLTKRADDEHSEHSLAGSLGSHGGEHRLRHSEVELSSSEKSLVRVFRTNGTFGTLACPADASTAQLLRLATRKFFIQDPENYRLIFSQPDRQRVLAASDQPVVLLNEASEAAGYTHEGTEDISFLARFVLERRPTDTLKDEFLARPNQLRVFDYVEDEFPAYIQAAAAKIQTIEMYRCSVAPLAQLAQHAPNVRVLRIRDTQIPELPSVLQFEQLQTLDLRNSGLVSLDLEFDRLHSLRALDISGNCISHLPSSLAGCPLRTLLASTNLITEYGLFLPTLEQIDLDYNMLSSMPPEITKCTSLKRLQLAYNRFTRFPRQLEYLDQLQYLDLTGNSISQLSHCRGLSVRTFKFSHNNAAADRTREVKVPYFYLPNASTVDISFNGHGFVHNPYMPQLLSLDLRAQNMMTLPDAVIQNVPQLQHLNVAHNGFTTLPACIINCGALKTLDVSYNSLTHLPPLPPSLTSLNLASNNLKSLPALAPTLRSLNVSSNLLENLAFIENLELDTLSVADNRLIDDVLVALRSKPLRVLNLGYNDLSEIPPGIFRSLPTLESLVLSGNRLGTLPQEEFEVLTNLRELYLNGNRLNTIPAEFAKLEALEVFDVSDNSLRYNVCNWPFDWNWRWNKRLKYLNFSSNRRLEIKRSRKEKDLTDLNVLPQLAVLGLIDVTVLSSSVPDQTENRRVRTYGADVNEYNFGIADALGTAPLGLQDLVVDQFRGSHDEALIGLIDGQNGGQDYGNRISRLVQQSLPNTFRSELERSERGGEPGDIQSAICNTFQTLHADIGNLVVHSATSTAMSGASNASMGFDERDIRLGTGVALCYVKGHKLHIGVLGGTQCVVSLPDGGHRVLNQPHVVTASGVVQGSTLTELDRVRRSCIVVDNKINGVTEYTRLIGCYNLPLSRVPFYVEYDLQSHDILIIASAEFWTAVTYETAADIARSGDAALAALKLRDLAIAYGCSSRLMVMVLRPQKLSSEWSRKRKNLPSDTLLARLGEEVAPPIGDVTLVFTDIRQSTLLWESMPSTMRAAIKTHNSVMRRSMRLMAGYEVKTEGDAFIVAFHSPAQALQWCLTVQQQLLVAEWPAMLLESEECRPVRDANGVIFSGLRVRMGIHRGRPVCEHDPITGRMDYFGPMVNKTSRISSVANGGQIMVSREFLKSIEEPLDIVTVELGELKLKGIESPEFLVVVYPKSLKGRSTYELGALDAATTPGTAPNTAPGTAIATPLPGTALPTPHGTPFGTPRDSLSEPDDGTMALRRVCQRLEGLCAVLNGSQTAPVVQECPDLEAIVTRIENATAQLGMRLIAQGASWTDILQALRGVRVAEVPGAKW